AGLEHIARSEGALIVRLQCSPHRSNSDLHPLHEHLRQVAGIQRADPDGVRRRKLERVFALSSLSSPPEGFVDCLVEIGSQSQVNPTSASLQRERQIRRLLEGLAALCAVQPIIILHEDAQWIDPESAAWLARLVEGARDLSLLMVVTARREYEPDWITLPHARMIAPRRLGREVTAWIVNRTSGGTLLAASQIDEIVERSTYAFRHALIQEAAHASLLRGERVFIHRRIADVLRAASRKASDASPEMIAYHCDCAELYDEAAQYWLIAGKAAAQRGSVNVAVGCFKMGLASAKRLPSEPSRSRAEFELLVNLGPATMAERGYASQDGLETFRAARALLHHARGSHEELQVFLGLFNVHFGRGELRQALDVASQAHQHLSAGFGGYPVLMGQAHCYI
ncbi:MAG: hypothetical protein ABL936_26090, partial [Aestuariivirga sp.]